MTNPTIVGILEALAGLVASGELFVFEFGGAALDDVTLDDGGTWQVIPGPGGNTDAFGIVVIDTTVPRLASSELVVGNVDFILQPGDELVWVQLLDGGRVMPDSKFINLSNFTPAIPNFFHITGNNPPGINGNLSLLRASLEGYEEIPPYLDVTSSFSIDEDGKLMQSDYFSADAHTQFHWNIYPSGTIEWLLSSTNFTWTPSAMITLNWQDPTAKKTRFQAMIRRVPVS